MYNYNSYTTIILTLKPVFCYIIFNHKNIKGEKTVSEIEKHKSWTLYILIR